MVQVEKANIASSVFVFLCFPQEIFANALSSDCGEGQYLVREHYRSGYVRTNGVSVSPARVSAYCRNYATPNPPEIHFLKKESQNSRPWPIGEKKRIQDAFNKLPQVLTHVGKVTFYRGKKDRVRGNPASVNTEKKEITIYDSIYKNNFERVIAHELAHILYRHLSNEERKVYSNVAEWKELDVKGKKVLVNTRKTIIQPDSGVSPNEDFANNLEYYLFDKKALERKNPKIYQWIKRYMEKKKK